MIFQRLVEGRTGYRRRVSETWRDGGGPREGIDLGTGIEIEARVDGGTWNSQAGPSEGASRALGGEQPWKKKRAQATRVFVVVFVSPGGARWDGLWVLWCRVAEDTGVEWEESMLAAGESRWREAKVPRASEGQRLLV